ncbi:MAG: hypothetical protein ACOX8V_07250 [Thermoleophilia bacterium]|jgi:hypothetical protein
MVRSIATDLHAHLTVFASTALLISLAGEVGMSKIGLMICGEGAIPEAARNPAFNGAEIILDPLCQGIFIEGLQHGC